MTTSVVLLMLASTVVVLTLLAASTIVSSRRATVARRDAVIELQQWSSGRGWTVPGHPPAELVDRWADKVHPGERLLMAAHGFERGHHCAALLYDGPDSEGAHAPRYVALLIGLPEVFPRLRLTEQGLLRRGNPPLPDQPTPDPVFDRRLRVDQPTEPDGVLLLIAPVRAVLLTLLASAPFDQFVTVRKRTMRVVLSGWPAPVTLTAALDAAVAFCAAMTASPPARP